MQEKEWETEETFTISRNNAKSNLHLYLTDLSMNEQNVSIENSFSKISNAILLINMARRFN